MIRDLVATAGRCGAGTNILVRADSAYCNSAVVAAITGAGARFSLAIAQSTRVTAAIAGIGEDAWTRITYPWKIPDPETGELIDAAEVAEVDYTAFTSKPKKNRVTARLIVRRIPERNPRKQQGELFTGYRYHAVFTNTTTPLVAAESTHRGHAVVEQVIRDLKNSALAHLPSGRFPANAAWLVCATIAFNLTRTMAVIAGGKLAKATTATIRDRLIRVPARVARSARRLTLHLPENWPWEKHWTKTWTAVMTT